MRSWRDCIEQSEADHVCENDGDDEPGDDDITTEDYRRFYQYGHLAFTVYEADNGYGGHDHTGPSRDIRQPATNQTLFKDVESVIRAFNDVQRFWPNVFFVSDHGNAHRIEL